VLAGGVPGQGELAGQRVRIADAGQGGQGADEGGIGPGPPGPGFWFWFWGGPGSGQDGVVPVAVRAVPDHDAVLEIAQPLAADLGPLRGMRRRRGRRCTSGPGW
jgi:hypothetical protein